MMFHCIRILENQIKQKIFDRFGFRNEILPTFPMGVVFVTPGMSIPLKANAPTIVCFRFSSLCPIAINTIFELKSIFESTQNRKTPPINILNYSYRYKPARYGGSHCVLLKR